MKEIKKSIYFVNVMRNHGGGEVVLYRIMRGLMLNYEIYLVSVNSKLQCLAVNGGYLSIDLKRPFTMYGLKFHKKIILVFINFIKSIKAAIELKEKEATIVHLNGFLASLYFAWILKLLGIKVVVHFHDLRNGYITKFLKILICFFSDVVIVVSEAVASDLNNLFIKQSKIHVIYNGIPNDFFNDRRVIPR